MLSSAPGHQFHHRDPGRYDRRIKLIASDKSEATVWAMVEEQKAEERIIGDRVKIQQRVVAQVRFSKLTEKLNASWLAIYNGRRYDVESVVQENGARNDFKLYLTAFI